MILKKFGDWSKLSSVMEAIPEKLEEANRQARLQEAHFLRTKIVEGLREQAPGGKKLKPLEPTTLATRKFNGFKGTKALIERGDLRNSISVREDGDAVFIGVHKSAVGKNGRILADIAAVHEFGSKPIVIQMTPKMRRYLAAAFRKANLGERPPGSTGVIVVKIPARPFIGPIFEKYAIGDQVKQRIEERMAKILKGYLSK